MNRKMTLAAVICMFFSLSLSAEPLVYKFAQRDTCDLYLDVYLPQAEKANSACVVFAFGGGFRSGARNEKYNVRYMETLAEAGYVAVSIDYRLGLKAATPETKLTELVSIFQNAVDVAVEDMLAAVSFVYDNADEWGIDRSKIALAGSSAGAITALQCDYAIANAQDVAQILPQSFKPAAVVSCAGAVCIFSGKLKYKTEPSPTLFLHGTEDKLVNYNKFVVFGKGMYGSNYLVKKFKKAGAPYHIVRYENFGHEIATLPQLETPEYILGFLKDFVLDGAKKQIDTTIAEENVTQPMVAIDAMSYSNPDNMVHDNGYNKRLEAYDEKYQKTHTK